MAETFDADVIIAGAGMAGATLALALKSAGLEPLLIDPNASEALQERVKVLMSGIAASEVGTGAKAPEASAPKASTSNAPADAGKPDRTRSQRGFLYCRHPRGVARAIS